MTDRDRKGADRAEPGGPDPDLVRTEAERLVAAGLAAVSMAADRVGAPTRERGGAAAASFDALGDALFGPSGHRRHSIANGSPECCLCPVCRAISAARNPSPGFAERLASGVGFMAEGAARALRGVAEATGTVRDAGPGPGPAPGPAPSAAPWSTPDDDPWAAATADPPVAPAPPVPPAPPVAPPPPVRKTTAKKMTVKKAVAKPATTEPATATKVTKKSAGAKATVKKATKKATKRATGDQDR